MATRTGNKKKKEIKNAFTLKFPVITQAIAFSYFCMKMKQFGDKPEVNNEE